MKEYLDRVDENGEPTGEIVERSVAHRDGIRHRTAHLWLVRRRGGKVQVLMQKRSADKDSYPGCYDISSAGHIPAGDSYTVSALRELSEELGITASEGDLVYCGDRSYRTVGEFHGKPFINDQYSRVFIMRCELDEDGFSVQRSEIESVL